LNWNYFDHIHPPGPNLYMKEGDVRHSVLDYAWRRLASAYAVVPRRRARWLVAGGGRLVAGLKAAGMKRRELAGVKGSDPRKVLPADLLWRRTVVSQEWLAEKLVMKSAAKVNQQIRRLERRRCQECLTR
jgi:hypothetical protein